MNVGLRTSLRPPQCSQRLFRQPIITGDRLRERLTLKRPFSRVHGSIPPRSGFRTLRLAGLAGVGLLGASLETTRRQPIQCQDLDSPRPSDPSRPPPGPPPESIVNVYELSFGTVAGITVGVFIKKGAKAVAFFVGGMFVLLQYFNSMSLVRVDWVKVSRRFENLFYTVQENGQRKPPSVQSLWNWLVDFLTADFQPRATFIAGLLLGLRIG